MSDGPHRSLKMRPAWKRAAERLDRAAWSADERADVVCEAVGADFQREVPKDVQAEVRSILGVDGQPSLFPEQASRDLEEFRKSPGLSSMASALIDYADVSVQQGLVGAEAYSQAVQSACLDRGAEGARQMEEHYKREVPAERAHNVRQQAEATLRSTQFQSLGKMLANVGAENISRALAKKQTGLDAGPELRK